MAIPARKRGVSRSSRTLGRDAVDAAASGATMAQGGRTPVSDCRACKTTGADAPSGKFWRDGTKPVERLCRKASRTAKACGSGTRCWCQVGEGLYDCPTGRVDRQFAGDGGKTNSSPGRARHKLLKPFACGNAGRSRCLRCEHSCAYFTIRAHTRLRVHWAPGIPHALCFERADVAAKLSGGCRRGAFRCVWVWALVDASPSLRAQAKQSIFLACRTMDCFAALAMTS